MWNKELIKMIEDSQEGFSEEERMEMCEEMNGELTAEQIKNKINMMNDGEMITVILNECGD